MFLTQRLKRQRPSSSSFSYLEPHNYYLHHRREKEEESRGFLFSLFGFAQFRAGLFSAPFSLKYCDSFVGFLLFLFFVFCFWSDNIILLESFGNQMSGLYTQNFSSATATATARALSPHIRTPPDVESQYLTELLTERQKLGPFVQVLPICNRLLNQEIFRVSGMISNQGLNDYDRLQRGSPSPVSSDIMPNYRGTGLGSWHGLPHDLLSGHQGMNIEWQTTPPSPSSYTVKKILRLDIPADTFPNFNFVGRLLGPRGNSLKRVEASTGCRVYIRGKGSIKDPDKEESLRGRPGYEHLNDPLHVLIEAELPANIVDIRLRQAQDIIEELLKPVDESHDFYKRQQLRELAMLNSNLREESP